MWLHVLRIPQIRKADGSIHRANFKRNDTEINNKIKTNGTQLPAEDDPT